MDRAPIDGSPRTPIMTRYWVVTTTITLHWKIFLFLFSRFLIYSYKRWRELLLCMNCLNANNSFAHMNVEKLVCLAELYQEDFTLEELMILPHQLWTYIFNIKDDDKFSSIKDLRSLAKMLVALENLNFFVGILFDCIDIASCNRNCISWKSIFCHEHYQDGFVE